MNVARGVLLVDDDVLLTRSLSRELALRGFRVRTAASGEEALEAHDEQPYDAVLVDLHMSGMDGLSVIAQLRGAGCQAKLVLWSAHADVEVAVRALRVGADDVLSKPLAALDLDTYLRTGSRTRSAPEPQAGRHPGAAQAARRGVAPPHHVAGAVRERARPRAERESRVVPAAHGDGAEDLHAHGARRGARGQAVLNARGSCSTPSSASSRAKRQRSRSWRFAIPASPSRPRASAASAASSAP